MDIYSLLEDRDVSEITIKKMKEEKIDENVVKLMDDAMLANYLPKYGDRLALFHFCKNGNSRLCSKRKMGILERLRKKLRKESPTKSKQTEEDDTHDNTSQNASKSSRQVEIGWIHKDAQNIPKQVRVKQGGGTRKINMNKEAKKIDILKSAKKLFFPDGMSTKGPEENFIYDIWDFKQNLLNDDMTIGSMYNVIGLARLRFYLYTEKKNSQEDDKKDSSVVTSSDSSLVPENIPPKRSQDSPIIISESTDIINLAATYANIADEDSDFEVQFGPFEAAENLDATIPVLSTPIKNSIQYLRVHRGQVLADMISHFSNPILDPFFVQVHIEMVLPNGYVEVAEDNGGVLRDCLCEFWSDFYQQCTMGSKSKLPYLRHDYDYKKWLAVAKIIVVGWKQEGYFPIALSKPFMENCLLGETLSNLTECFMDVMSTTDKEILQLALSDFGSVNEDELFDVLDNYSCKTVPNKDNMASIIEQIAHKTIVQEPKFVIDCWREACMNMGISRDKINEIYNNLIPNPRRVIKCLDFPEEMNMLESNVSKHLQRFIKDLESSNLRKFLRFVTGADLMIKDKIFVRFVDLQGICRRPIAHTCGCVLEIPKNYDNYPDFKTEFLSILESSVWVMDIV